MGIAQVWKHGLRSLREVARCARLKGSGIVWDLHQSSCLGLLEMCLLEEALGAASHTN